MFISQSNIHAMIILLLSQLWPITIGDQQQQKCPQDWMAFPNGSSPSSSPCFKVLLQDKAEPEMTDNSCADFLGRSAGDHAGVQTDLCRQCSRFCISAQRRGKCIFDGYLIYIHLGTLVVQFARLIFSKKIIEKFHLLSGFLRVFKKFILQRIEHHPNTRHVLLSAPIIQLGF